MITQQLLDYIAQEIQLGVAPDAIKATLRSNGWIEADIEQALRVSTPAPQIVISPTQVAQPVKTEYFIPSKKKSPVVKILLIVVGLLLVAGGIYAGYVFTSVPSLKVSSPTTNPIPEPLPVATSTPEIPLDIATTTATSTPHLTSATSTASTTSAKIKIATSTVSTTTTPVSSTSTKAH